MNITVRYFALLREALGFDSEALLVPEGVRTVAQLRSWLAGLDEAHAKAFSSVPRIRAAVNLTMASEDSFIAEGDEVAFLPPVTGG